MAKNMNFCRKGPKMAGEAHISKGPRGHHGSEGPKDYSIPKGSHAHPHGGPKEMDEVTGSEEKVIQGKKKEYKVLGKTKAERAKSKEERKKKRQDKRNKRIDAQIEKQKGKLKDSNKKGDLKKSSLKGKRLENLRKRKKRANKTD
jgi:hypothetical protein